MFKLFLTVVYTSMILFSQNSFAYVGELLQVYDVRYEDMNKKTPSCRLLIHRNEAFSRQLRERQMNMLNTDFGEYIRTDKYISKLSGFNLTDRGKNLVNVKIIAEATEQLVNEISSQELKNVYFSLLSTGLKSSLPAWLHTDLAGLIFAYHKDRN